MSKDVEVMHVACLDDDHAAQFEKDWLAIEEDGTPHQFDTEVEACLFQQGYRVANGLDPATGEPKEASQDALAGETAGAVEVFAGHLIHDGIRIQVDFQAPIGASVVEKDAAFMAALVQRAEVDYLAVGHR